MNFNVGPVRVQACFANHPGVCVGYRLFTADGSIAFFPDNEPHHTAAGARTRRRPLSPATRNRRSWTSCAAPMC